jgi:hypothetical protein
MAAMFLTAAGVKTIQRGLRRFYLLSGAIQSIVRGSDLQVVPLLSGSLPAVLR